MMASHFTNNRKFETLAKSLIHTAKYVLGSSTCAEVYEGLEEIKLVVDAIRREVDDVDFNRDEER